MANNSLAVSQLPAASNVVSTDQIVILFNAVSNSSVANGSPSVRTITVNNFVQSIESQIYNELNIPNYTPSTSSSNGVSGTITYDSNYFYVCIANNVWKRASLTTW